MGVHCSLIVQKERENSSCQICQRDCDKKKDQGEHRARGGKEKKKGRLVGAAKISGELAE